MFSPDGSILSPRPVFPACPDGGLGMIYTHSVGRAARYYPVKTAFSSGGHRQTFQELHARIGRIASALVEHGFNKGDRLALLLPNETEFIELIYACAWVGLIVVPLN